MSDVERAACPHCGARLVRMALPDVVYDHEYDLVCFNDECSYYVRGWAWMEQQFGVKTSYRYRIDSRTGHASPVAVWSPTAMRNKILPDDDVLTGAERTGP